jgi:hypothetical protein
MNAILPGLSYTRIAYAFLGSPGPESLGPLVRMTLSPCEIKVLSVLEYLVRGDANKTRGSDKIGDRVTKATTRRIREIYRKLTGNTIGLSHRRVADALWRLAERGVIERFRSAGRRIIKLTFRFRSSKKKDASSSARAPSAPEPPPPSAAEIAQRLAGIIGARKISFGGGIPEVTDPEKVKRRADEKERQSAAIAAMARKAQREALELACESTSEASELLPCPPRE